MRYSGLVFVILLVAVMAGCGGDDATDKQASATAPISELPVGVSIQATLNARATEGTERETVVVEGVEATLATMSPQKSEPTIAQALQATQTSSPQVNSTANLRAGPGTEFNRVGSASAGEILNLAATNQTGDWYQLASGAWIAAFLVDNAPDGLPVAETIPSAPEVAQVQTAPAQQAIGGQVRITGMLRDGKEGRNEPDEYVEITNVGDAPQDMTGWRLESERRGDDTGQIFYFPQGFVLQTGQACRIYTNQDHPEFCGLNFRHTRDAIWSNSEPDAALLYDQAGSLAHRWE